MTDEITQAAIATPDARRWASRGPRRFFDEMVLRVCARLLGRSATGRLHLTLPSGAMAVIGGSEAGVEARMVLRSYDVFWRSLRRGSIGFAESYMRGQLDCDDLVALFTYFIANRERLHRAGRGRFRVRGWDTAYHAARANTRAGARVNISAHYDLGNAFYRLWLDPSLTYSSALYTRTDMDLESAQRAKQDCILAALELQPGHRLLEIGCGWGAFAARAAERGADVTGLTLSAEQQCEARAMMRDRGHDTQVEIKLEDYRDTTGDFDRLVSIEMIEAVGEEHWPEYFATIRDRLVPGGVAVLQAITIDDALFPAYRRKADFIQRYIFPGGMLPTKAAIAEQARAAGLECEVVATFGASYARTLAEWRQRFRAQRRAIGELGFDERFLRMWDYYLAYCEAGFERGTIDVGIYRLRKRAATTSSVESG